MESVNFEESIDKVCACCKISKTPLWRSGPAGPKSLCNACGIRYRKKSEENKSKPPPFASPSPTLSCSAMNVGRTMSFKKKKLRINMVALGKEVVLLRRQRSPVRRVKRQTVEKFGEVEEAAFVLMSLSCGLVYG